DDSSVLLEYRRLADALCHVEVRFDPAVALLQAQTPVVRVQVKGGKVDVLDAGERFMVDPVFGRIERARAAFCQEAFVPHRDQMVWIARSNERAHLLHPTHDGGGIPTRGTVEVPTVAAARLVGQLPGE